MLVTDNLLYARIWSLSLLLFYSVISDRHSKPIAVPLAFYCDFLPNNDGDKMTETSIKCLETY